MVEENARKLQALRGGVERHEQRAVALANLGPLVLAGGRAYTAASPEVDRRAQAERLDDAMGLTTTVGNVQNSGNVLVLGARKRSGK